MLIKKITPAVINAFDETARIYDRELSQITDKIANDTFTSEDVRYADQVKVLRAKLTTDRLKYIAENTPKNAVDRLFNKLVSPLIPN
jgi:hypothetical protein